MKAAQIYRVFAVTTPRGERYSLRIYIRQSASKGMVLDLYRHQAKIDSHQCAGDEGRACALLLATHVCLTPAHAERIRGSMHPYRDVIETAGWYGWLLEWL